MSNKLKFPDGFLWGSATASYQVEGGIENNDWAEYARLGKVPVCGIATDHYNHYESDFDLASSLGQNCHRISIEWSRIEKEEGKFDMAEIEHYRDVLKALNKRGLKPFVTLWHFTLPIWFAEKGGFENKNSPEIFAKYCQFVVKNLHDLTSNFSTMNEPMVFVGQGYLRSKWPPFKKNIFSYFRVLNNLIKAHNLSYKNIKEKFPNLDINLVKHNIYFSNDMNLINLIKKIISRSFFNHYFLKRTIKNCDSIGLNYYTNRQFGKKILYPKSDMGWGLNPDGLFHVLLELKKYNKDIYITEAGLADEKDKYRAEYIKGLVHAVHRAIGCGARVRGFMYWSLLDNYEWAEGFGPRFGLIEVDYKKNCQRRVRQSAYVYKDICDNNFLTIQ